MTARALDSIGKAGGPRCCKRDSFLAILAAIDFTREHLGVEMKRSVPVCSYSSKNNQCIGGRCPFSAGNVGIEAELQVLRPVRRVKVVKKPLK